MAIVVGYAAEADRGQRGKTAGAVAQAGYLVPVSLKHF
jgi:hypothetical protein